MLMKKSLLLVFLLLVAQFNVVNAQGLFTAPDTICVKQPVYLVNNTLGASSYYWGFCSGYVKNDPTGSSIGASFGLNNPGAIDIAVDNGHYWGFVANRTTDELVRLDFGNSLTNVPTVTNYGNANGTLPHYTSGLSVVKDDSGRWFMFVCGGTDPTNASFARYDFGRSLGNTPNAVNFGNPLNLMSHPRGMTIGQDNSFNWYAFMVDSATNGLLRLNFGNGLTLTPILNSFGNVGGLNGPSDVVAVKDGTNWRLLITNEASSTMSLIDLPVTLSAIPTGTNIGNLGGTLFNPSSLTVIKDCGATYAFVTNKLNDNLTSVAIPSFTSPFGAKLLGIIGAMVDPASISTIIRDRDNLYAYTANGDGSLSRVLFSSCTDPSILSSTAQFPPVYKYYTAGTYNVYLAINEGLPNMQVDCKQIYVEDQPKMSISNDTVLCQGDSIYLFVQAPFAIKYAWRPNYNISDTLGGKVRVWPEYTLDYFINIPFPDGCIVDTPIHIDVSKVKADAGPDRTLSDGAKTVLGGPLTTTDGIYLYNWSPSTFLSSALITNPVANPGYDITYYLEVTELNDNLGCRDIDTVVVKVKCNDLNLPNAFSPESASPGANTFGLLNRQIVKLNYFRIYDRWGHVVFSTTDPAKQWDGLVNNEPANVGVYVWDADGFCITGARINKQGNVTLIR